MGHVHLQSTIILFVLECMRCPYTNAHMLYICINVYIHKRHCIYRNTMHMHISMLMQEYTYGFVGIELAMLSHMGVLSQLGLTSWQDPNMPLWKDNGLQGNRISCNTITILSHKKTTEINSNQYLIDYKHARYQFCDASYSQTMGFTRNSVHWRPHP